jgi:twitching motility protein PilT
MLLNDPLIELLRTALAKGAAEVRFAAGLPMQMLVDGRVQDLGAQALKPEDVDALMQGITPDNGQQELNEKGSCDFGLAFAAPDGAARGRFCVAVTRQNRQVAIVMRRISFGTPDRHLVTT